MMPTTTIPKIPAVYPAGTRIKRKRIESIDLLRGIVMIIMVIDHVRDYFHHPAFKYDPADLEHTSVAIFFYKMDNPLLCTHICIPGRHCGLSVWRKKNQKGIEPVSPHKRYMAHTVRTFHYFIVQNI